MSDPPHADLRRLVEELDEKYLTRAWENREEVQPWRDRAGTTYCWLILPSRNTWPTRHKDRPAPTPHCACAACHRPRCCGVWAEPVVIFTGETVAWICPTCLESVATVATEAAVP